MAALIPRRLVRTVPEHTSDEQERLWEIAIKLHPDWEHITLRDPIDRAGFPITADYWAECESGAQLADLVRAEELYHRGGVYIDSDVECYRPFDPLLAVPGFAAWEDHLHIPNAVMGFTTGHRALTEVVFLAIDRRHQGTWKAGVGVTTEVFRRRDDMLLLPPGSFYPVHWREAHRRMVNWRTVKTQNPWAFAAHKYAASWH